MGASRSGKDIARRSGLRGLWLLFAILACLGGSGVSLAAPEPDRTELEAARLDLQLKRGQVELLARERALRDRELAKSADNTTWSSPLVVAVFAAAVAALGSALVALVNGLSQRGLESSKAESDRILEVVKTGDPEKAAVNLRFLIDAGLVSEPKRVAQLNTYLSTRQAGAGVALPTPGRFAFATHGSASEDVQKDLAQSLNAFQTHLHAIGFRHTPDVQVKIHDEAELNAFFSPRNRTIEVHPLLTSTPEIVLVEYAGAVLWGERAPDSVESPDDPDGVVDAIDHFLGLFIGVREYVVASYLGDPLIGAVMARLLDRSEPYLRNLEHLHDYAPVARGEVIEPHAIGEIWGGALWEIRARAGKLKTDTMVAQAWEALSAESPDEAFPLAFIAGIEAQARRLLTEAQAKAVADVFVRRKFPQGPAQAPDDERRPRRSGRRAGPRPRKSVGG